jgi:hypothetical protein
MKDRKFKFRYNRRDSLVLKKFFRKAHIKDYPFLRKCWNLRPESLLTYLRLKESGFRDINLYNRVISDRTNYSYIDKIKLTDFTFFLHYCLTKKGEIAALNLIIRKNSRKNPYIDDSMAMFHKYFRHIPQTLRADILKDGFTEFNHDALSEISYKCENKNRTYKYSAKQKSLQDDIDGYSFRLPKNSNQLCEIGAFLHNCVATYSEKVYKKECTIVYAIRNGQYEICIEVRDSVADGRQIIQELTNRNAKPTKEQQLVLDKWHERHKINS